MIRKITGISPETGWAISRSLFRVNVSSEISQQLALFPLASDSSIAVAVFLDALPPWTAIL
jgi:hypothetical protein